jgi:hypothetical protein
MTRSAEDGAARADRIAGIIAIVVVAASVVIRARPRRPAGAPGALLPRRMI